MRVAAPAAAISAKTNSSHGRHLAGILLLLAVMVAAGDAIPAPRFSRPTAYLDVAPSLFPIRRRSQPLPVAPRPTPLDSMERVLSSSSAVDPAVRRHLIASWRSLAPTRFTPMSPPWNALLLRFLVDTRRKGLDLEQIVRNEIGSPQSLAERSSEKDDDDDASEVEDEEEDEEEGLRIRRNGGGAETMLLPPGLRSNLEGLLDEGGAEAAAADFNVADESNLVYKVGDDGEPTLCKLRPFRVCFKLTGRGDVLPVGVTRPTRLLRVY